MHEFVLDEAELGTRVAMALDDEACGLAELLYPTCTSNRSESDLRKRSGTEVHPL
jgi:hypothetical protein